MPRHDGGLAVTKRSIQQGSVAIDLTFDDNKATGTIAMGGESKPFSVDVGGGRFADGAGAGAVLATLPLEDGYEVTIRNLDANRQKLALKQTKVMGLEEVPVRAGTFRATRIEMTSAEGEPGKTTDWIAMDSRRVVKTTATLPQMGGAILTAELLRSRRRLSRAVSRGTPSLSAISYCLLDVVSLVSVPVGRRRRAAGAWTPEPEVLSGGETAASSSAAQRR